MLSSCSEGMKNCDNGSAYLQTLDTFFFENSGPDTQFRPSPDTGPDTSVFFCLKKLDTNETMRNSDSDSHIRRHGNLRSSTLITDRLADSGD